MEVPEHCMLIELSKRKILECRIASDEKICLNRRQFWNDEGKRQFD